MGRPITGYMVTPYIAGVTAQTAQTFNSTATTETVTGLTNGTAYTFKVAAINSVGTGSPVGSVQLGHSRPPPRRAHHRHGHQRQRLGHPHLDGAGLQRRVRPITGYVVTPYIGGVARRLPRPSTRRPPPRR